jgi:hypothetical protein
MIDEGLKSMNTGFLRGHVAQPTQRIIQLTLQPGDEEIKNGDRGSSGRDAA